MSAILPQVVEQHAARHAAPLWVLPLSGVLFYPGYLLAFDWALNGYRASGDTLLAAVAGLAMLLAFSVPVLAARALFLFRDAPGPALTRALLCLMIAVPSLFTMTLTLTRFVGVTGRPAQIGIWVGLWLATGVLLHLRRERVGPARLGPLPAWLRVAHGGAALGVLCGFLLWHLANHVLAISSVPLHREVMEWLRLWYRSGGVEPVLLTLLLVMIATGVPMVGRHSRQRMDGFRVVQAATGIYVAVFLCSHVIAILLGRSRGVDTDWYFAAGPNSLLDGSSLLCRLIPHYACGTFFFIVHLACGLRIVLLQHGVNLVLAGRIVYVLAGVGILVTTTILTALLGWHAA